VVVSRQGQNLVVKSIFNFFWFCWDVSSLVVQYLQMTSQLLPLLLLKGRIKPRTSLAAGHMYGSAYALCWTTMISTVRKQKVYSL
jgi:hypothetical protein